MIDIVPTHPNDPDPDDWMVYGQPDKGGCCATFFYGTEQECREYAKKYQAEMRAAIRTMREEDLAQERFMTERTN